jgi:hypothetical protein
MALREALCKVLVDAIAEAQPRLLAMASSQLTLVKQGLKALPPAVATSTPGGLAGAVWKLIDEITMPLQVRWCCRGRRSCSHDTSQEGH